VKLFLYIWYFAVTIPGVVEMIKKGENKDWEPDWMNPANDRKTPYTDEEIELFVDGFILGLDDHEWLALKEELGEAKARQKIMAGIIHMDENNLINITPDGAVH
jgi:hypothetical protein